MRLYGGVRLIDRPSLVNVHRLDLGCLPLIHMMHKYGMCLDATVLGNLQSRLEVKVRDLDASIRSMVGNPHFNPGSPDQVAELLFREYELEVPGGVKLTRSGKREEVGDEVLSLLVNSHPVVQLLRDRREVTKLLGTYVIPLPQMLGPDGRLHTNLKVTTARTGRLASEDPNCFDGDTEVLTADGWVPFRRLPRGVRVAQWRDGAVEFVRPTGYVVNQATNFHHIYNDHVDLMVTPDHRCMLQHRKTGAYYVMPAVGYKEDYQQLNAGVWAGDKGLPLTDAELRLLVATQADGSWDHRLGLDFSFHKQRKVERLLGLLSTCGARYSHVESKGPRNRFRVYAGQPLLSRLISYLGVDKKFGPWLLQMSRHQADVFLEEVYHWDGCYTTKNTYASIVRSNAEWVQTLHVLSGHRANLRRYRSAAGSVSWQVDVTRRNYSLTTNVEHRVVDGGMSYCVSVPSSYLLVRRNGKVMVTGNCQNIPTRTEDGREVRAAFVAGPGNVLASLDLSQIEMVWTAHLSQDPTMMDVFRRGLDMHIRTTCSVFHLDHDSTVAKWKSYKKLGEQSPFYTEMKYLEINQRLPSKTIGFALVYGQTPDGMVQNIATNGGPLFTVEETEQMIEGWFATYPEVRTWMEYQHQQARRYGLVWDAFGRPRLIPEVRSALLGVQNEGLRQSVNTPVQASAQGTIKVGMAEVTPLVEMFQSYPSETCWPILQVHDELIFELSKPIADDFCGMAKHVMETCVPLSIPTRSSSTQAPNWKELK